MGTDTAFPRSSRPGRSPELRHSGCVRGRTARLRRGNPRRQGDAPAGVRPAAAWHHDQPTGRGVHNPAHVHGDGHEDLADPQLRVEHCDRLLKLFLSHEASSIDGYAEGFARRFDGPHFARELDRDQPRLAGQSSPKEHARRVRDLKNYYRRVLDFDGLVYAQRFEQIASMKLSEREDALLCTVAKTAPGVVAAFSQSTGRMIVHLRATECMIVIGAGN